MDITSFYFIYLDSNPEAGYLLLELIANKKGCAHFFLNIFCQENVFYNRIEILQTKQPMQVGLLAPSADLTAALSFMTYRVYFLRKSQMISFSTLAISSPYQRLQGFLIDKKWARWLFFSQNGLNFFCDPCVEQTWPEANRLKSKKSSSPSMFFIIRAGISGRMSLSFFTLERELLIISTRALHLSPLG